MEHKERLSLAGLTQSATRHERRWQGFSVEHVSPAQGSSFSYDWTSELHFCAYHDIVLKDGGIRTGDGGEDHRHDLRHTLTYVPRGARVSGWSELTDRRNSYTALYFHPSVMRDELGTRFSSEQAEQVYYRNEEVAGYFRQWARILGEDEQDPLYEEALGLVTVLAIHRSTAMLSREARPLGRATLALILDFVEDRLGSTLSLTELAAMAGLSRFHFSRAFKAETGETPYQHVLRRRIERAKLLLADATMPLEVIARSLGFHDVSHFQKAFKARVGISAQRFRDGA